MGKALGKIYNKAAFFF